MRVYVLTSEEYDGLVIWGVHATVEGAQEAAEALRRASLRTYANIPLLLWARETRRWIAKADTGPFWQIAEEELKP